MRMTIRNYEREDQWLHKWREESVCTTRTMTPEERERYSKISHEPKKSPMDKVRFLKQEDKSMPRPKGSKNKKKNDRISDAELEIYQEVYGAPGAVVGETVTKSPESVIKSHESVSETIKIVTGPSIFESMAKEVEHLNYKRSSIELEINDLMSRIADINEELKAINSVIDHLEQAKLQLSLIYGGGRPIAVGYPRHFN